MTAKYFINANHIVEDILEKCIREGHVVVDMTVGNGYDTLKLAKLIGVNGRLYGFDIQEQAISISKEKILKNGFENRVKLILDNHKNVDSYIKETVDFVIYNLGYLPGGNKEIITRSHSTIESLTKILKLLKVNGLVLITCYTGHDGGYLEYQDLIEYLRKIDQKKYTVIKYEFINQKNKPPILIGIEKIKEDIR